MNDRICISTFIRLLLFSWQKRGLIGWNGKAGFPTEKFDFCVRNHGPLSIIVISVVPLSKLNKICQKKKNVQLFSVNFREDWSWLLSTFIYWLVPFLFTIFQIKRKLPPFAYTLCSPFLTTGESAYSEADEHDNSFQEGLEDGLLFRWWSSYN